MLINQLRLTRRHFLMLSTAGLGSWPEIGEAKVIRDLGGEVFVNNRPATLETLIQAGDTVTTGAASKITFVIGQDVFKLGARSTLKLEEGNSRFISLLRLLSGQLTGAFGKGSKQILSPAASIGVRGTAIFLKVESASTYFCDCYGETQVTTVGQQPRQHSLKSTHHQALVITHEANPQMFLGSLKFHRDAEAYELESVVGRQPPVTFK